jgi:RNA polymerase sigma-70 factor (ECF subfamily)
MNDNNAPRAAAKKPLDDKDIKACLAEIAPELYGRALHLARTPHAAADLVQDTVERALRFEAQYKRGTNFRAWVHQILFSVFVSKCRRARRERNALSVVATDPEAWMCSNVAPSEGISRPMERALETVPKAFREAVVLVDVEELSYKDAAKSLGVPVGTVMSRLHRGRKHLAEAIRVPKRAWAA